MFIGITDFNKSSVNFDQTSMVCNFVYVYALEITEFLHKICNARLDDEKEKIPSNRPA